MASVHLEKSICSPPCLTEVSPVLPLKRFQCSCDWQWPCLILRLSFSGIDEDYDMCFYPSLFTAGAAVPFALSVSSLDGFTLMVWVRYDQAGGSGTFLTLSTSRWDVIVRPCASLFSFSVSVCRSLTFSVCHCLSVSVAISVSLSLSLAVCLSLSQTCVDWHTHTCLHTHTWTHKHIK